MCSVSLNSIYTTQGLEAGVHTLTHLAACNLKRRPGLRFKGSAGNEMYPVGLYVYYLFLNFSKTEGEHNTGKCTRPKCLA